ncbi:MAG: hypothetical protein K1X94_05870 [Sandaracinaceae bacterium]|jgi:hypothetical protein|nr:hypothetical protein [Sandaracinaceae bacterium]
MHPLKRAFLVVVFSLGTVGGFAHGFAHLGHCMASHHAARREAFEDHVADVCTRSAERVIREEGAPAHDAPTASE